MIIFVLINYKLSIFYILFKMFIITIKSKVNYLIRERKECYSLVKVLKQKKKLFVVRFNFLSLANDLLFIPNTNLGTHFKFFKRRFFRFLRKFSKKDKKQVKKFQAFHYARFF